MRIDGVDGPATTLAVHGGFLHVTPESVTILAESAEIGEEIDVARARAARDRADSRRARGCGRRGPRPGPAQSRGRRVGVAWGQWRSSPASCCCWAVSASDTSP